MRVFRRLRGLDRRVECWTIGLVAISEITMVYLLIGVELVRYQSSIASIDLC
jgi:hypothetical protein